MKLLLLIPVIIFCATACNDKKKVSPGDETQTEISAEEKQLKEAIAKYPDSLLLKEYLIELYSEYSEFDKAMAIVDNEIKKDSGNPKLWQIKATVYLDNADTISAIKNLETAVIFFPKPDYVKSLASLYAQTKNKKALMIADSMIASKKTDAVKDGLFLKGWYYNYIGEFQKAIKILDQCLSMDYTYMFAYREKAVAFYSMGKYEDALSVLEKATTIQNGFDEGYYWMGRCYEKLNKKNEAIENYQLAIKMAERNNDYNIDAEQALERLGVK